VTTTTKYHGKNTVLLYAAAADSAPTINLSGSSRTIEIDEQGSEQDVSTRDDLLENATAYLTSAPQRTVNLQGLDTTPANTRTWHNVSIGDIGRVAVYPNGMTASSPYEIGNVSCTNRNYSSPHDNAAAYTVKWRVTGPWTAGTV
jgi:hypothetical protein